MPFSSKNAAHKATKSHRTPSPDGIVSRRPSTGTSYRRHRPSLYPHTIHRAASIYFDFTRPRDANQYAFDFENAAHVAKYRSQRQKQMKKEGTPLTAAKRVPPCEGFHTPVMMRVPLEKPCIPVTARVLFVTFLRSRYGMGISAKTPNSSVVKIRLPSPVIKDSSIISPSAVRRISR